MRGYGQFCPVALGAEVFAERWTPLILRELLAGSHRFSELQRGLPGIPRALLTQRLGSLQRAGLVERRPARAGRGFAYHLSPAGLSFSPVVEAARGRPVPGRPRLRHRPVRDHRRARSPRCSWAR
jgi:DNA-binding HxlR family transcriptional regulator